MMNSVEYTEAKVYIEKEGWEEITEEDRDIRESDTVTDSIAY